jgi:hypothetical protein
VFSRLLGGPIGGWLILQRNFFVERIIPAGVRRKKLSDAVMNAYRGPFPTPQSRRPVHVFPREILASRTFLAEIESKLVGLVDRPALVVWGTKDFAFRAAERRRWEQVFPEHHTVLLDGPATTFRRTPRRTSSLRFATGGPEIRERRTDRPNRHLEIPPRLIPCAATAKPFCRRPGTDAPWRCRGDKSRRRTPLPAQRLIDPAIALSGYPVRPLPDRDLPRHHWSSQPSIVLRDGSTQW